MIPNDAEKKLWSMRMKLRALADLFMGHDPEYLLDEDGYCGIGQILNEITEDLKNVGTTDYPKDPENEY